MYDFLDLFDRGLPQLRRIQLSINDSATESCRRPLSFLSSPKLDSVIILSGTGISRFLNDKNFLDAFPQSLRVVDQYVDLQPTTILSLLSKFRGLEVIILRLCETGGGLLPEDTKFCFSHTSLRHLHLAIAGAGIRSLFRAVQFPFLRSLSLSFIKESAGILELVAEASPPLERLALNCFKVGTDELLRFLEQTPTITHLSLVECDCFNWSLISSLTLSRRNRVQYLPKPEYFEIGNESDTVSKVPSEDLIEFVESRWWYSSLSTVVIWEDEEREEEEWQEHVSTMRDEGLEYFMDTMWKDCWDCGLDVDWLETR
ncbi:hypothetical protein AX16_008146 [Volvariella volvacea WC 439]|nr:hypothetical protein AX16_008146 [Volvariella volvacea WC 439]